MSSSNIAPAKKMTFSVAITTENYKNLINNTLKEPGRANRFIAAITSAVAATPALQTCDPRSILCWWSAGRGLKPLPLAAAWAVLPCAVQAESQV